jgi:hypothetical protein
MAAPETPEQRNQSMPSGPLFLDKTKRRADGATL